MKVVKRRNRQMTMERILRAMGDVMAERYEQKGDEPQTNKSQA